MKQSALVIATLFAAVQANKNHDDAKERMERDIHGYLNNGMKFDMKVAKAVHQDVLRVKKAQNHFKQEARENFAEGHAVMDEFVAATKYQKAQQTVTQPSAATKGWGNVHQAHPQQIMDKWMKAFKDDIELQQEWKEDFGDYMQKVNKSHEILGNQVESAWETNGKKSMEFGASAIDNLGEAMRPQSLASQAEVMGDFKNWEHAVGDAAGAVRNTMRTAAKADAGPDRRIDQANQKFMKEKMQINKGFAEAIEFEIKNTHIDMGKPGGEGHLDWSNKQKIVNHWKAPIVANQKATQQWHDTVQKNMEEKRKIHEMAKAEAKKVWPAKFEAVEKSWNELAENFDNDHSLASRAEIKTGFTDMANSGYNLDKAVVDDVVHFHNDTIAQRKAFKDEVETYIKQKEAINQQYDAAFDYEMENIHFENNNGKWNVDVENKDQIIDKWADAQTNDVMNQQELKSDWINYQKSIAAEKAAFKATAKATWPKAFEAYKQSVQGFMQTMQKPQSMISDADQAFGMKVREQVYDNANDRMEFRWEVKQDLKAYMNNTKGARDALKADHAQWKAAGKRVSDMYAAAWAYQVENSKFTPATAKGPATIELEKPQQVSNNWRSAAQADEDLGGKIMGDIKNFNTNVKAQREVLKKEIKTEWIPSAEKINRSNQQIGGEVVEFWANKMNGHMNKVHARVAEIADKKNTTSPFAENTKSPFAENTKSLMSVESSSSLSMNEQLAYGTVFLMAMIAVAALSNKGKAESKTVEFDVEDLEMTNKKESKKQIKQTLKQIMKTSNTKVTLMNN